MNVLEKLQKFYNDYPYKKGVIGKTERGKDIYYLLVEKSSYPTLICQYSIHAREYITTYLALLQIKEFIKSGKAGRVYFIPMVNVDGVEICLNGKPLYKANARGVDLNVNFNARWGTGKQNKRTRGDQNYIGAYPFSESETKALRDFTLSVKPDMTLSYHSKGEEIYYEFFQDKERKKSDYRLAKIVADKTGYAVKGTPDSAGGYKDWCIEKLLIPSLTIEVGSDKLSHPIGERHASSIFKKNKGVLALLTKEFLEKNNE